MDNNEKIVVKKPRVTNKQLKRFQRLNLTNDFMFKHCFAHKEILKPVLEELWNKEIGEIVDISHDYRIQLNDEYRYVVCDIYIRDSKEDIYILEMQKEPEKQLRKRSVCYQAISIFDQCTNVRVNIEKEKYASVSECYIAFLCCFDVSKIFEREEFPNLEQVPNAIYRSNNMMFVNIKNYSLIENERLQELFKFILNSDTSLHASWDVVQSLQKKVEATRRSKDMAVVCYVSKGRLDERYDDGRREGIQIGEQRGYSSANADTVLRMYDQQFPLDTIAKAVALTNEEVQVIIGSRVLA